MKFLPRTLKLQVVAPSHGGRVLALVDRRDRSAGQAPGLGRPSPWLECERFQLFFRVAMVIEYVYEALTDGLVEEPVMVLDTPANDAKRLCDFELEEKIQRFTSHTQDSSLKVDKTKLVSFLDALLAEKARREKSKETGATSLQQITEKRCIGSDRNTPIDTGRNSKERKVEINLSRGLSPPRAFDSELKILRFQRGRKQSPATEMPKSCSNGLSSKTTVAERGKQHRFSPQVLDAEETSARRNTRSSPDTVVLFSSDDENEIKVMEPAAISTRRTSSRIAARRKMDLNMKIAYPSKDDPDALEVYYGDFSRLQPAEFLNDTVIDFYIKYLQREAIDAERKEKFHFYSSFFFKKLSEAFDTEAKQVEAFSKLRKWTKGIDIFSKSYLFLPINDRLHWSLAIVCFSLSDGGLTPYIFHLDSLDNGHSSRELFKYIQKYLELEHAQMETAIEIKWRETVKKRVEVPRQENEYDCGLFLLYYIKRFVETAPLPCKLTDTTSLFGKRWFKPSDASMLRWTIREILENLFEATSPE
ncbi:ubiquitin-like-specific protease 1D [Selaginella moellendorffii]|uniref:ubiquitin-like-specific protease 1D n=1 Tax=Selaginella moellendorffii TaxID=88036 RepID=UPI000D1C4ECA|nr:ubiquitin-like-specific protease 1D [Selaginella moellendorffii]XP_024527148.1 ubiquitin-like-specific protease 1D [Selaginella moellendorffii]XP_024527149.1 ubiquitin-like-specific protease 1D [Selaginella moellendorffii]|eukprot:XP_024527147.1 ubiquitin-like-specific protease 1D [Selaginella moellendorffii]